jgi:DNA-binding IclR family transcriptional regulator
MIIDRKHRIPKWAAGHEEPLAIYLCNSELILYIVIIESIGNGDHRMADRTQQGVQSVETGLGLVGVLASLPGGVGLKALSQAADMSPAKAHRYLVSLIRTGMVEQEAATARYRLGPTAVELGLAALRDLDPVRLGGPILEELRNEIEDTVLLAIWGNKGPVVVRWEESARAVTTNVRPGFVMPLMTSSTGRTFAAFLPDNQTRALLSVEYVEHPERCKNWPAVLAETRDNGLGRINGDLLPGISALSAPVFNHQKEIAAVLSALGPSEVFDSHRDGKTASALKKAAHSLSIQLGVPSV